MSDNKNVPMSAWEWDGIVNDPAHQAEGDRRALNAAEVAAENAKEKEELFENFYENSYERRRERTQIAAARYALAAIVGGVLSYICGSHGIGWLAWTLGCTAGVLGLVSSYGFGIVREMNK